MHGTVKHEDAPDHGVCLPETAIMKAGNTLDVYRTAHYSYKLHEQFVLPDAGRKKPLCGKLHAAYTKCPSFLAAAAVVAYRYSAIATDLHGKRLLLVTPVFDCVTQAAFLQR